MNWFETIVHTWPVWMVGLLLFATMFLAASATSAHRAHRQRAAGVDPEEKDEENSNYIFSAVAGLLALLLGFTFSMAVERFDSRRVLVLQEANTVGTAYLRAQLLPEPHRARMTELLKRYAENRVILGSARTTAEARGPLRRNDALITDLWTGVVAAWPQIRGLDFSSAFIDSMNTLIDLDATRKTARAAHVPLAVFAVLCIYMIVSAAVLGHVITGRSARLTATSLLALFTLALMLIVDIDQPIGGRVKESQTPMVNLLAFIETNPPSRFDRWSATRTPLPPEF